MSGRKKTVHKSVLRRTGDFVLDCLGHCNSVQYRQCLSSSSLKRELEEEIGGRLEAKIEVESFYSLHTQQYKGSPNARSQPRRRGGRGMKKQSCQTLTRKPVAIATSLLHSFQKQWHLATLAEEDEVLMNHPV